MSEPTDPKNMPPESLEAFFEQLQETLGELPESVLAEGAGHMVDFIQGKATLAEMFAMDPEALRKMADHGMTQYNTGRFEDAEKVFRVLMMLDGNNAGVFTMLGRIYEQQKKLVDAVVHYGEAITLDADNGFSLVQRANLHMQLGLLDEAEADLNAAGAIENAAHTEWGKQVAGLQTRLQVVRQQKQSQGNQKTEGS